MFAAPPTPTAAAPFPARLWWLKRLALLAIVYFASILSINLIVSHRMRALLDARIAAARAQGDRLFISDYVHPLPPPATNAAFDLMAAAKALKMTRAEEGAIGVESMPRLTYPLSSADLAAVNRFVSAHRSGYAMIRAARGKPNVDWPMNRSARHLSDLFISHLDLAQELKYRLKLARIAARQNGDDPAALEYALDQLFLARCVGRGHTFLSVLIRLDEEIDAIDGLRTILPMGRAPHGSDAAHREPRKQLRKLLSEMRDETSPRVLMAKTSREAPAIYIDLVQDERDLAKNFWRSPLYWVAMPSVASHDLAQLFDTDQRIAADAMRSDLVGKTPSRQNVAEPHWHSRSLMAVNMSYGGKRLTNALCIDLKSRRLATIHIALILYKADYGVDPPSLNALVGTELDALPTIDPTTGGPLVYPYVPPASPPASHPARR